MISYKFQGNVKNFDKRVPKNIYPTHASKDSSTNIFPLIYYFLASILKFEYSLDISEFEFSKRNKFFSKIPIFPQRTRLANSSVARI